MSDADQPGRRGRPRAVTDTQILDAVETLGLSEFSVSAVGRLLGVRDSTIYNYFPTRNDLVAHAAGRALQRVRLQFDELTDWVDYLIEVNVSLRAESMRTPGLSRHYLHGPFTTTTLSIFETQIDEVARRRTRSAADPLSRDYAFTLASFASTTTLNFLSAGRSSDEQLRRVLGSLLRTLDSELDGTAPAGMSWSNVRKSLGGE